MSQRLSPQIIRLRYPHISKEFPGKIDMSTPYAIGKIVSRLEMDSNELKIVDLCESENERS